MILYNTSDDCSGTADSNPTNYSGTTFVSCTTVTVRNYAQGEMESEIVSQMILNAVAAREFLRFGLFVSFGPPKCILFVRKAFWLKQLRCNRRGIGLRIKS